MCLPVRLSSARGTANPTRPAPVQAPPPHIGGVQEVAAAVNSVVDGGDALLLRHRLRAGEAGVERGHAWRRQQGGEAAGSDRVVAGAWRATA